ncbi:hypothetical protein BDF19DRAFT_413578 [Syncephalis fuscata]|nr:hypothetical protein BDF19DRAFT_413578 [Syncephalis fuscata]
MAADAMTAAELNESMSAPSTLRQSGPIPGLAHSLVGQTAAGTRSENASTVGTPGAPSHGQVDFVKRIDTGSLLLKMISRRPGETKHKCIKFPFILEQDTPEDVVNEMVREQVLDEDDRDLAVCNIRCAVERGRLASELAINTAVIGSHNSSESGPMSSSCSSLVGMRRTSSGRSQPDDVHAQLARYHAYHQLVSPALAAMSNGIPSSNAATAGSMHYPANGMLPHLHHSPTDVMSMSPYSNLLPQPVPGHHPHAHHRRSASSGAIPFDLLQHGSSFSHSHLSSSFPSPTPLSASLSDIDNYSPQLPSMRPRGRSYAGDPRLNHEFMSMAGHRESSHLAPIYTTDRNMNDAFFSSRRGQTPTTPNDVYVDYREAAAPMSRRTSTHSQHQLASLAAAKVKQMAASTSGRAVLQQQQQQQHAYETSMLHLARARGISFASSPRSEHGDLTTDGTVATGDTSLISPLFGSPRFDDEVSASASSPGDLKEIGITNKSSSGFAEVLVARSPSTAGIGVVVMDSSIDSLSLSNDPTLRPHPQSLTHNLNSNSSTNSHANSLSIGIPQLNGTDLSTYPISPLNCVDNNSNSNNDTVADVDVSDPKLIELWEKQRREAEEMARTHMVEWEQLVQDLREKRVTDRSTPSITANTAT